MPLDQKVDDLIEDKIIEHRFKNTATGMLDVLLADFGFGGIVSQFLSKNLGVNYPIYPTEQLRQLTHELTHHTTALVLGLRVDKILLDADTIGRFGNYLAEKLPQTFQVVNDLVQSTSYQAFSEFQGEGLKNTITLAAPLVTLPLIGLALYTYGRRLSQKEDTKFSYISKRAGTVLIAYGVYNMMEPIFNTMSSLYAHSLEQAHILTAFATEFYQSCDLYKIAEMFDVHATFPQLLGLGSLLTGLLTSPLWAPKLIQKTKDFKKEYSLRQN